ncbi:MAG: Uma2 family endonuclease [Planctomycetales bacterium]|nr:Uma2 family endonuclease [Planctomycetales bacterium]
MSTTLRITADEYDRMIERGAFVGMDRRIELIRGELRQMSPAGPVHEDYIDFLTRWSTTVTGPEDCVVRVQNSIDLDDSRPEPDVTWLRPGRYAARRPKASDVLLLIEVADSSLAGDMGEKADLYAEFGVAEYWVVDCVAKSIHVFTDPKNNRFAGKRIVTVPNTLSPACKTDAELRLGELFV